MHYPGMNDRRHYRAVLIGAGFGGVAVGAALGQAGIDYVILCLLGRFDVHPYHQLGRTS